MAAEHGYGPGGGRVHDTGPRLVVGDGHLGIWGAPRSVYPEAREQRCWKHKLLNVLDKLPKAQHAVVKPLLCRIPYAATRATAERQRDQFVHWCDKRGYARAPVPPGGLGPAGGLL